MNWWWLVLGGAGLFFYLFLSVAFAALVSFKHHDTYPDAAFDQPRVRPAGIPPDALLVDLHCHTTASDGLLEPVQLVRWSIANGYDGLVVSDHNTMDAVGAVVAAAASIDPGFIVIPGCEFTSMRVHLNLIRLHAPPPRKPGMLWTRKATIQAAIDHAHAQGAVVQFNHKDWYPYNVLKALPRSWWLARGIDGWEVRNGFGFHDEEALEFIEASKATRVMFAGAGTDVHDPAKHWRVYTEVLTSDRTAAGVVQALREGKTRVHFDKSWERNMARPEKGSLQVNPGKVAYLRRWVLLGWAGVALLTGKGSRRVVAFVPCVLALLVVLSLLS